MSDGSAPARSLRVEFDGDLRKLESAVDAADSKLKGFSARASNDLGKVEAKAEGAAEAVDGLAQATTRGAAADDRAREARGRVVSMTERMANEAAKAVGQAAAYERQMRAAAAALSAQGLAQERAFQSSERLAAGWRSLSAQGAAQARVLDNLRAANDNTATAFSAQATQIGALIPGFGRLTALVGGLSAALLAAQFVQTVTQFQAIDASLKAAIGSTEGAQSAMAFVRAESDRLGLSLASTAKDFASFAAATRGTELQGQKTREIFSAVAEAGTVLGLSAETMSGALNALTQMASKGTVQGEELRGQLGDLLPGALNIAAKAMGATTAEFNKMLEQGQVIASDFLPKFAAEMHRTFGPEAANASNNLRANINRLQTAITDLYLAAGKGGLTDALNDATRQATAFLKASQGTAASAGGMLAAGLRNAGAAFEFLRRNSDLAGAGLAALIALRFGPAMVEIAVGIGRAVAAMSIYDVATKSLAVSQTAAVASSRALSLALSAFGGPVGIAITAVAAGVAYLALRQDEGVKAVEAQAAGLKMLDAALQQNRGSLAGAADETKRLAAEQLTAAQAAVTAAEARLRAAEVEQARVRAQAGGGGVDAFFYEGLNTGVADREAARAADELTAAKERMNATLRLTQGVATDADRALLGLGASAGTVAASLDAAIPSMQKYADAMSKLIAMVPQLQQAVDAQAKLGAAKSALDTALASAGDAHLKGEISFKEMAERGAKARETYKLATEEVTGYAAASKKLDTEARGASIAGMEARSGAIAKLKDDHAALVQSYREGANAQMTEAQRAELVGRAEGVLAQKIANTNKMYDERAAKKAAAGSGTDAFDTAFKRSEDSVEELKQQAESAGKATEQIYALTEANRLRRAALSAGRTIDADLAGDINRQADAYARQRKATEDALEGQRRLQEGVRALGQEFGSFVDDIVMGGRTMGDAFGSLAKSLGSSGLQALLTGQGSMAGLLGTAPTEKGQMGGLLGGLGNLDFSKFEKAISEGSFEGVYNSLTDWVKPAAGGAEGAAGAASGGFASSKLGGGLMAAGIGASVGYSSGSPIAGALSGGLAGLMTGNPWLAVAGAGAGLVGGSMGRKPSTKGRENEHRQRVRELAACGDADGFVALPA